ncbi:MAG TPA: MFS transporter [Acidimicrobiales bacterium]|nr:MFS transporter [Acidimicrobiales bacterium]
MAQGDSAGADVGSGLTGARRDAALASLCALLFLTFLDNTIISVTLADVQSRIHAGVTALQWVVNGYALVFAGLMLTAGTLSDIFGRKKVMLAGVGIFCAGSVIGAVAPTPGVLIAGRVVMGIGAAASEPGTLSMIRHIYPDRAERARAIGVWAAVSGLALALGPVIGGVLVGLSSFRLVFWFNLAFGAVAGIVAGLVLPENSDPGARQLDVPGFLLGSAALVCVTFAVISGENSGYSNPGIIGLFAASAVTGVGFLLVERRSRYPVLQLELFRNPTFAGANFVSFAAYFGTFSIFFFVALYLLLLTSTTPYGIAVDFLPMSAGMILASVFAGRWVAATGPRLPMVIGCVMAGAGIVVTDGVISPSAGFGSLAGPLALAGVGFGIAVVPVTSSVLAVVPARRSGMAASTTNTSRELGAVFGVAILGTIVNGQLTTNVIHQLRSEGLGSIASLVINALTTGNVTAPNTAGNPSLQNVINKATAAAENAFAKGLDVALMLSGAMLLAAGLVALFTIAARPRPAPEDDSELAPA